MLLGQTVKDEIDARVDHLKHELDRQRDELFEKVNGLCDKALRLDTLYKFNISVI